MTRIVTSRSSSLRAGGVCANPTETTSIVETKTSIRRRARRMMPLLFMRCHPAWLRVQVQTKCWQGRYVHRDADAPRAPVVLDLGHDASLAGRARDDRQRQQVRALRE